MSACRPGGGGGGAWQGPVTSEFNSHSGIVLIIKHKLMAASMKSWKVFIFSYSKLHCYIMHR